MKSVAKNYGKKYLSLVNYQAIPSAADHLQYAGDVMYLECCREGVVWFYKTRPTVESTLGLDVPM